MTSNGASTLSDDFQSPAGARDVEKVDDPNAKTASESFDIEHVHVDDDPRKWSNMRKVGSSSATIDFSTGSVTCNQLLRSLRL